MVPDVLVERLLDATAAALVAVDLDGRTLFWNRGAERLFGWARHEVVGQPLPIVPSTLQQEWRLQMRFAREGGGPTAPAETQRLTRDGRLVPVLRSASPLVDARGAVIGLIDTLTDIASHKQLNEESRALAQVRERELIAMDLHDGLVQSLYGVVLGLAAAERELGSEGGGTGEGDGGVASSALRDARQQIERVIEEARTYLLDLRVREFSPPDLSAGLRLLVDGLRLNGGLECALEIDAGADELLAPAARGHVLYLVREAASNVVRHAQAQHVRLRVARRADGQHVLISLTDDGRGFDQSASGGPGHHGLRNMAERARLMGARLTIESQPGQGTCVRLDVPCVKKPD